MCGSAPSRRDRRRQCGALAAATLWASDEVGDRGRTFVFAQPMVNPPAVTTLCLQRPALLLRTSNDGCQKARPNAKRSAASNAYLAKVLGCVGPLTPPGRAALRDAARSGPDANAAGRSNGRARASADRGNRRAPGSHAPARLRTRLEARTTRSPAPSRARSNLAVTCRQSSTAHDRRLAPDSAGHRIECGCEAPALRAPAKGRSTQPASPGSSVLAVRPVGSRCGSRYSWRSSESPISQIVGGHRPTKRARRSAFPRSS